MSNFQIFEHLGSLLPPAAHFLRLSARSSVNENVSSAFASCSALFFSLLRLLRRVLLEVLAVRCCSWLDSGFCLQWCLQGSLLQETMQWCCRQKIVSAFLKDLLYTIFWRFDCSHCWPQFCILFSESIRLSKKTAENKSQRINCAVVCNHSCKRHFLQPCN